MAKSDGIAPFLLAPNDPYYRKPKTLTFKKLLKEEKKLNKLTKTKKISILKIYFKYLIEVISA